MVTHHHISNAPPPLNRNLQAIRHDYLISRSVHSHSGSNKQDVALGGNIVESRDHAVAVKHPVVPSLLFAPIFLFCLEVLRRKQLSIEESNSFQGSKISRILHRNIVRPPTYRVTAPSDAEDTSLAYFAITPLV